MVLSTGSLYWKSSALTTMSFLHCSLPVSLISLSNFVDTSSTCVMVNDEETAGVTEHIVPIP